MNTAKNKGPFVATRQVVLGSGSPRRKEFFDGLGIDYTIDPARADEPKPEAGEKPQAYAERMAFMKAADVAARNPEAVVVGSDTIVTLQGEIMGKPTDDADALRMLTNLSGKVHQVVSGCCVIIPGEEPILFHATTDVEMRTSTEEELRAYIATGEPTDKAGAYAIQGVGTFLVRAISGSYTNVVGLPVSRLLDVLLSTGVVVPSN